MPTRFVPNIEFEADLEGYKTKVLDYIKEYYDKAGVGPKQEEIRDNLDMDNDLVTFVLNAMVEEGKDIKKIQA